MVVIVNGSGVETAARTLADLLRELGYAEDRIATAVDGEFVAATDRSATRLKDGAKVEIVSPRQGG